MSTRVSVIIPTYDRVGFVETAIRSVLDQDHPDVELIVLDDGSSDGTDELLRRIETEETPERFRWARHDNVGQAETTNRGLALATGELLGYLSSDDRLLPGALTAMVAEAEAHPEAELLYPMYRLEDGTDRLLDVISPAAHTWVDAVRWMLCCPGVGALVRRRLYERIGGWDPTYRLVPDFEWFLRARDAEFRRVDVVAGVWRAHAGSITIGIGPEAGRERQRLLDAVYAEPDLPEALLAVRDEAYASLYISMAVELGVSGTGGSQRFQIRDELAAVISRNSRESNREHFDGVEYELRQARRRLELAEATITQLDATVAALEAHRDEQDVRAEGLRANADAARGEAESARSALERAPGPRAAWLGAARTLVPPALRPRLGAAAHRIGLRR